MNENQNLTWGNIKAMFAETSKLINENAKQSAELDRYLKEDRQARKKSADRQKKMYEKDQQWWKETKEHFSKMYEEDRQSWKETKERLKEMYEETRQEVGEMTKGIDKLGRFLGGIANSNGDMAEEFFYHTIKRDKIFLNEKYDKVWANGWYNREEDAAECDIYLFNGTSAAIIEVKYKAKHENVNADKLIERVARFREHYPDYKNHKVYLGVAALAFNRGLRRQLHQAGIATIHQIGKKMVVFSRSLKLV